MISLIPMAGAGSRFVQEGYKLPKPLIEVDGKPMVVSAIKTLPESEKYILICRDEHISENNIDEIIKENIKNSKFITIDKLTEGQASTCLLAKEYINNEKELMIAASDNGMLWDKKKFEELKKEADCLVWTFRNNKTVVEKPEAYGWCIVDDKLNVKKISVKKSISDTPMKDHSVVGAFWFKEGKIFVEAAEKMIKENRKIKNEFYVDEAINDVIELGYKVKIMEIDKYICWGTPNDLRTYNYWKCFFKYLEENPIRKKVK